MQHMSKQRVQVTRPSLLTNKSLYEQSLKTCKTTWSLDHLIRLFLETLEPTLATDPESKLCGLVPRIEFLWFTGWIEPEVLFANHLVFGPNASGKRKKQRQQLIRIPWNSQNLITETRIYSNNKCKIPVYIIFTFGILYIYTHINLN